jgi:hypothetical protein
VDAAERYRRADAHPNPDGRVNGLGGKTEFVLSAATAAQSDTKTTRAPDTPE